MRVRVGTPYYNRGGVLASVRRRVSSKQHGGNQIVGVDFGLLQLQTKLMFNDKINAIKLPANEELDYKLGSVSGWGVRVGNEVNTFYNIIVSIFYLQKNPCKAIISGFE